MKLLFVIPEYYPHPGGGIATYYENLLPRCAAAGHGVDVLLGSPHTLGAQDHERDGVRIQSLRPELYWRYREQFRRFDIFPDLRDQLAAAWAAWEQSGQGSGYDLVECTDWGLGFVPWIVGDCDLPVRVRLHGSTGQIEQHDPRTGNELQAAQFRLVELMLLPHADALATYSPANQAFWAQLLDVPVQFHYPGLHLPPMTVGDGLQPDPAIGLVVGRVQYWKGPTTVCEAMRLFEGKRPQVRWIGRDMPYSKHRAGMNAFLSERYPDVWGHDVVRTGALPPADVRALQARSGFGLVPSTWDVFNLVCVEFMSFGRPVVCSTGAGASGLIVDGENGFLFEAGNAESLKDALVRLATTGPRLPEISRNARATVASELDLASATHDLIARSTELVDFGRGTSRPTEWMRDFVAPRVGGDDYRAILDQLPLRNIASYNVRRGMKKLVS